MLRRLAGRCGVNRSDGSRTLRGLFVDVETTGLHPDHDEIIELAMVPFLYSHSLDGRIFEIREPFEGFRQPTIAIPPAITILTGITEEMVAGKLLDVEEVSVMADAADLIVGHLAAFDRRFVERLSSSFTARPWACSLSQVDWGKEGDEGTKLAYLAMGAGFFYDRHRSLRSRL